VAVGCEVDVALPLRDSMTVAWRRGDLSLLTQQGEGNIAILPDSTLGKYGERAILPFFQTTHLVNISERTYNVILLYDNMLGNMSVRAILP